MTEDAKLEHTLSNIIEYVITHAHTKQFIFRVVYTLKYLTFVSFQIGWEVWLKATTSRRTSATLTELIEGSEYKFRVKAENPYGVSDPSEESDVVFIPDPKRR